MPIAFNVLAPAIGNLQSGTLRRDPASEPGAGTECSSIATAWLARISHGIARSCEKCGLALCYLSFDPAGPPQP